MPRSAAYELDNTICPPVTGNGWYLKELDGERLFDYRIDESVHFVCKNQHPSEVVLAVAKHLAQQIGVELDQIYYKSPISKRRIDLTVKDEPHRYNGL